MLTFFLLGLIMRIVLMLLLALCSCQTFSNTQKYILDNGLKIVVREDHRAPVVVSMVWYNVGSADEPGGITGISHALEHIMFKGTPNFPLGVFSQTIAALGGQENAFTNYDYTAYFEKIAAPHLETSLKLEADRMQHLLLDPEEFSRELKVIQEERRLRTDDNPQALTFERFLAAAHLATPYHHPVIGWMNDIENLQISDLKAWYQRYYTPNNATLVVVGDVNPKEVLQLAKQYFSPLTARPLPTRKPQLEPPALGKKQIEVHAPAKVPLIMLGYTVPTVKSAKETNKNDAYALEVLAGILDAGDSSRFSKHLVRGSQVASSIAAYYNLYARYQTQFILYAIPSEQSNATDLKKAMFNELNRLKQEKISEQELKRVKTQIIAEKTFERDSIFGQAMEIGMLETLGLGWQTSDQYIEQIKKITPEDLQKAARKYFVETNLTEAQLIPEKKGAL